MPYKDVDEGHRISLTDDVLSHAKEVFDKGLELEAILLAHEYLEQRLNAISRITVTASTPTIHRRFKQVIEVLHSERMLSDDDYGVLNEFNRLRNVNANQILDFSLTLRGAKKGDMQKAVALALEADSIVSRLFMEQSAVDKKTARKHKKRTRNERE